MKNFMARCGLTLLSICCFCFNAHADFPATVTLAGNLQSELGCPGDWQPECSATHLVKNGSQWSYTATLPPGTWEYKITLNDSWTESYGYNVSSDNAKFILQEQKIVTFFYDEISHQVTDTMFDAQPTAVTVVGSLQKALGCVDDWQAACAQSQLIFDEADAVWQQTFLVPAGSWQYKATLNNDWTENYGTNGKSGGDNINFSLAAPAIVKFYYSNKTHWVTNNVSSLIATVVGNFQQLLGCSSDWSPDCLRTWMQDVNGTGLYSFSTNVLPVGTYEAKVALNESWAESMVMAPV